MLPRNGLGFTILAYLKYPPSHTSPTCASLASLWPCYYPLQLAILNYILLI